MISLVKQSSLCFWMEDHKGLPYIQPIQSQVLLAFQWNWLARLTERTWDLQTSVSIEMRMQTRNLLGSLLRCSCSSWPIYLILKSSIRCDQRLYIYHYLLILNANYPNHDLGDCKHNQSGKLEKKLVEKEN